MNKRRVVIGTIVGTVVGAVIGGLIFGCLGVLVFALLESVEGSHNEFSGLAALVFGFIGGAIGVVIGAVVGAVSGLRIGRGRRSK